MFGRNRMSQEEIEKLHKLAEQDERFFSQVRDQKDMYEAGLAELAESHRQMRADAAQVLENIKAASSLAEENTKVEAELGYGLNECSRLLETSEENQAKLLEDLSRVTQEAARLVDENKHFTSPSKYLSELPAAARAQNQTYSEILSQMGDYGKQMGILALNAAIEAGRMGESGRQFVTAAEEIRVYATHYDRSVQALFGQLEQSGQRIEELENQVKNLVKLLKGSNVAAAKLMRSCNETLQSAKEKQTEPMSREVAALRGRVTILKNADEEIIKSEERNRMQIEDLMGEFEAQEAGQKEVFELMDPLYRHVDARGEES